MKNYCVVYKNSFGIHYRFRCSAENKWEARRRCRDYIGIKNSNIVSVEEY